MSFLKGAVEFNGSKGEYSVIVENDHFEREVRLNSLIMWDALIGGEYYQSNFGSPVYRRPGPFSTLEGTQWLTIWQEFATFATDRSSEMRKRWEITSILGNTSVEYSRGTMLATTDVGNITEYGPATILPLTRPTLRPAPTERIDFSLPFDLSIGIPRAQITVGGKPIQVIIDTGADHSVFASSLIHEELATKVKVSGAGGIVDFTLGVLNDLRLGGTVLTSIMPFFSSFDVMPAALRWIRGIIGQDILGRAAVTFDQRRGLITGRKESENGLNWPIDGSYTKAIVDGKEGWYRIDTGSAFTLHVFTNEKSENIRGEHHGIGGTFVAKPVKITSLQLDNARFSNIRGFEHFSTNDSEIIAGNIGNQILKELMITMDFAKGLASFERIK